MVSEALCSDLCSAAAATTACVACAQESEAELAKERDCVGHLIPGASRAVCDITEDTMLPGGWGQCGASAGPVRGGGGGGGGGGGRGRLGRGQRKRRGDAV